MAPVFGFASALSLPSRVSVVFLVLFFVLSALITNSCVSAVLKYDRHTLFRIKETMNDFSVTWARSSELFPPNFEYSTSLPVYLLVTKHHGRRRKRGSRAGVQARLRKQRGQPPCPIGPRSFWVERCLRSVPVCKGFCAPPSLWTSQPDRSFLNRRLRNSFPRDRILSPVTRQLASVNPDPFERAQPARFALFNARSITNKAFILNDLFTKEHIDFMFLTETWQQEMEYTHLNELCPPDCSVFGTPRVSRRGGGLALVYRDRFCCRLIKSDSFDSFELQMTKVGNTDSFYCVLIYRPPGPARLFLDDFAEFLSSIIKLENVLMLGDFNFHIDDTSCTMASEFLTLTESFHFKQCVSGPTHIKGHTLDLVFSLGLRTN